MEAVRGIKTVAELSDVAEWMIEHDGNGPRPRFRASGVRVDYPGVRVLIDVVTGLTGIILVLPPEDESSVIFNDGGVAACYGIAFVCIAGVVVLIDQ